MSRISSSLRKGSAVNVTIIQDSREKNPLILQAYPIEVTGLPVGDYGIKGFSDWENPQFIVERKSLNDLIGSLTRDRARFEKEVLKMRQFQFRALLIEAEEVQIEIGDYRSAAKPNAILQSLASFQVRHNIHIIFGGSHNSAARVLERLVRQFVRGIEKDMHRLSKAEKEAGVA